MSELDPNDPAITDPAPQTDLAAPDPAAPAGDGGDPSADPKGGDKALLNGGASMDDPKAAADWPDDWRKRMVGDDERALKVFERFASPVDAAKALIEAQNTIRSGKHKEALPENPSDEQLAAWRKDNGIPEKPEGYLDTLPDGLVIGDDDKDLVNDFLGRAHASNMTPQGVAEAINWYYEEQEKQVTAQIEADRTYRRESDDALRGEWGGEYRANINAIENFLATTPVIGEYENDKGQMVPLTLGAALMDARLPDGTKVGDNPTTAKFLLHLANEINPGGTVAPGDATTRLETVKSELDKIRDIMTNDRDRYNKDEAMQARFLQLLDAEQKLSSRA